MISWRFYMKWCFCGCLMMLFSVGLYAQQEDQINNLIQQIVESYADDEDDDIDVELLTQNLTFYYQSPLNLNKATFTELSELQLLNPPQIDALLNHRKRAGDLLNIYELQSIKYFDLATIERLLPFVEVKGAIDDVNIPIGKLLSKGKHFILARYAQTLEDRAGYLNEKFLGSPQKLYARYQYQYGKNFSYGFTAEKDAGEPFGGEYNPYGFDFYSFHVYLKDYGPFKYLALGDYRLDFGQGLIVSSSFNSDKSDEVLSVMQNAYTVKQYTSAIEALFNRGIAATVQVGNFELTAFGSYKPIDARLIDLDDIDDFPDIGTFQIAGLHQTESNFRSKNTVKETFAGTHLSYDHKNFEIGLTGTINKFSAFLTKRNQVYNNFRFRGDLLLNSSLNYRVLFNNFHFFGEWAISTDADNSNKNELGIATLNGVLVSIDPKISFTLVHRHYNKFYEARYERAFSESTIANNESSLYLGTSVKPNTRWKIDAYADFYRHRWLRFLIDAPSQGFDYRTLVTYKPSRKVTLFVRYKNENKQRNLGENETRTDYLVQEQKSTLRADVTYKLSKALRFKTRIERSTYQEGNRPKEEGFLAFQDVNVQPIESRYSFNARFTLFDTDSYDTRIYVYENTPLYAYGRNFFYQTGYRYYFNVKWEPLRMLDLWAKVEQTKFLNVDNLTQFEGISSGNNFIDDDQITNITLQARLKF